MLKQFIQILPNDIYQYAYTVYPLKTGYCTLPPFHVKFTHDEQSTGNTLNFEYLDIDSIIQNMLTTEIFVLPKDYKELKNINKKRLIAQDNTS